MSYSAITQPDTYMGAYSAVPLKLFDTDYNVSENYKYLVNICYDKVEISGTQDYILGGEIFTKLTSTTPNNFILGDYVFLNDESNSNLYTGYYIIKKIISSTEFVIDLTIGEPFGNNNFFTSKFIKYKFNPDLDGYAKVDMSNVLKDFVSQNLTGETQNYSLVYPGPNTKLNYELICGSEKQYVLRFDDNFFSGGSLCFISTGITSMNNIPFEPGDLINVEQDLYGWDYYDNTYVGSFIGFTGFTNVPFYVGSQIIITGQETFPYYNGVTNVNSIPSTKVLETQKLFQGNTPVEGGTIYGVPRPEYNGVCKITYIGIEPSLGHLLIITDKSFTNSSPVIPGSIQFADGRITITPNELSISGLSVYNAHLNKEEYTITEFDKYVIQNRNFNLNNLSTILGDTNKYRVEPNTIGFILSHKDTNVFEGIGYSFYNSSNQLLGNLLYTGITEDWYSPIGLEQIGGLTGVNDFGVPFTGYSGNIDNYCIYAADDCQCSCLTGIIKYKVGSGTTATYNLVSDGELNGRDYWDFQTTATTGVLDVRLWWVNDGISFKWYLTPQTNTGHTPFFMYDKDYNTDCPGDTLEWSIPVGSPFSGNNSNGTLFLANPNGGITQYSNEVCFELNKDCSMYEIYHLMWKDKLGSFISYPFIYVSRDNMEADRKTYYQQEGTWKNNTFGYEDYGRGEKDFFLRSRKSIIVNSGWLYEFERHLMEDLIQSPSVYLQTPDNRIYGGKLEEKKIEVFKKINEDIFSYSFNFIFPNNEYRF